MSGKRKLQPMEARNGCKHIFVKYYSHQIPSLSWFQMVPSCVPTPLQLSWLPLASVSQENQFSPIPCSQHLYSPAAPQQPIPFHFLKKRVCNLSYKELQSRLGQGNCNVLPDQYPFYFILHLFLSKWSSTRSTVCAPAV